MPAPAMTLGRSVHPGPSLRSAASLGNTRSKRLAMPITRCAAASQRQQERVPPAGAKVVGMGGCGLDYLAQVAAYPRPDEKLRTQKLEVQGGGNCGNALTAAARLGLPASIVSKIGGDSVGEGIIAEFAQDGVGTEHLLRAAGAPSPFTYIIVDRQGGTRTCIHTPSEPMLAEEMTPELAGRVLDGAALVYFDGRLTEPALELAAVARAQGVPVLVEGERLRPQLDELLQLADYVVTSAHFPQEWTGEAAVGDAILTAFHRLPNARWMITTLGSKGSVLLERPSGSPPSQEDSAAAAAEPAVLEDLLQQLFAQAGSAASAQPACRSGTGVEIGEGGVAVREGPLRLRLQRGGTLAAGGQAAEQRRAAAAAQAAAANADAENAAGYSGSGATTIAVAAAAGPEEEEVVVARVSVASAAKLPEGAVLDTTGAGDSFIGSMLYSLATRQPLPAALRLAAVVAACNCTALGARTGMPKREQLCADLL